MSNKNLFLICFSLVTMVSLIFQLSFQEISTVCVVTSISLYLYAVVKKGEMGDIQLLCLMTLIASFIMVVAFDSLYMMHMVAKRPDWFLPALIVGFPTAVMLLHGILNKIYDRDY